MVNVNPSAKEWQGRGLRLREYQKEGVNVMDSWYKAGHGGINGDEMGLGKTCQAIMLMLRMKFRGKGPFLVLCPLSVVDHWVAEIERFSCGLLDPVSFLGFEKARRISLKHLAKLLKNTVFVVPYHIFRRDSQLLSNLQVKSELSFDVIIVDEAHNLKNTRTQLAEKLKPYKGEGWFLLMTGTPIQNHTGELYSLLTFVDPFQFKDDLQSCKNFVETYKNEANLPALKRILSKYLMRRTKEEVCKELPVCEQVVIYHDITELQKRLYLDIIVKDREALLHATGNLVSLKNLHMQLRKCVVHPYLFKGVEPEPFVEDEHIVQVSGKFQILDRLLLYLKKKQHRCLVFSQFVRVLDIVQDLLELRGYEYERLDGNVPAEERFRAINNFQRTLKKPRATLEDPWCFLLSTKAGGVGLNLSAADTVIILDADWNPQNDIQAMARCHRIGQSKPVRVICLIGRYTVEQHMHARIREKLKYTDKVMGNDEAKLTAVDLLSMIKQSLGSLREQRHGNELKLSDDDLEAVIGKTNNKGEWLPLWEKEHLMPGLSRLDPDEVDRQDTDYDDYLVFEGHRYRISAKDEAAFEELRLMSYAEQPRAKRRRVEEKIDGQGIDKQLLSARKSRRKRRFRGFPLGNADSFASIDELPDYKLIKNFPSPIVFFVDLPANCKVRRCFSSASDRMELP
ncbi:unnamed protein product [Cylicocyclus nassatus]|uniref:Uncharacterized protein n=1 Tax=Cylicocyclus nassatus TaxID=53992 RepID=A0AA36GV38_CYLNA|nr:unnamed protein product [Cylicocyclus nassatus]